MNLVNHLATQEISCGAAYRRDTDSDKEHRHIFLIELRENNDVAYDDYYDRQVF